MKNHFNIHLFLLITVIVACSKPSGIIKKDALPPIYPDYADVTVPVNIAPLNFMITGAKGLIVHISLNDKNISLKGRNKIRIPAGKWHQLLNEATSTGQELSVTVLAKIEGQWYQYSSFLWHVRADTIDPYLSYRLIEPGYEVWKTIQIAERELGTFRERIVADNRLIGNSCMNCHIYGNQDPSLSFLHLRGPKGGTVLNRDGTLRKINIFDEGMISPAVYGNFHPSGRYAVYSTNLVLPGFHTQKGERLEVYDQESDLVIVDLDYNKVIPFPESFPVEFRTFPVFSATGDAVYYCNAPRITVPDSIFHLRYDLLKISFNADTGTWGNKADTVFRASSLGLSVCHPKTSPDGRYLLFTMADYGTFPIWHQETDLWLLDLESGKTSLLEEINSPYSDTYHSWSSNSRWFVFASKRDDGLYGKPYFCYVDREGNAHKPFVLPQKDPETYHNTLKSYNIPELSRGKLPFGAADIERIYNKVPAEKVSNK
ncbi:MAG TPA: hypothetical protein PK676_05405 [Bacteroidales bacterium]|nr:hypothetical protein [Bacteroidales bacterium]HQB56162.1 hypothetical protein [Bacteroidales bacterium]